MTGWHFTHGNGDIGHLGIQRHGISMPLVFVKVNHPL